MTDSPSSPAPTGDVVDATRRTRLASERTELAWWGTGLAALAVALAVGRVVPGLEDTPARWPYTLVGICFAIYGIGSSLSAPSAEGPWNVPWLRAASGRLASHTAL